MSKYRYDLDLIVELNDFKNSGYEEILKLIKRDDYSSYWDILSKSAKKEKELGNDKKSKVLWLLAEASSLMLNPKNIQTPYSPIMVMANGTRSTDISDFNENDIAFFENIVEHCSDIMLQARIADILWLVKKKKNIRHLEIAVNCYLHFPTIDSEFKKHTKDNIERAIRLTIIAKKPLTDIQNLLLKSFLESKIENNYQCLNINELLNLSRFDIGQNLEVIKKLESFAEESKKIIGLWKAREYYQSARVWYESINSIDNINKITQKIAESYAKEAETINSPINASKLYENAIQEYRLIPVKDRATYKVDERIEEIYHDMSTSNKLLHNEMQRFSSEKVDITKIVEYSISEIENKNIDEALLSFINICEFNDFDKLKKDAEKRLNKSFLSRLFGGVHYSADARVISRSTGGLENEGKDYDNQVESQTIRDYTIGLDLNVKGSIYPSFEQFILEHTITKEYLHTICLNSSIIPRDRAYIWAEGLYFGFEKNFLVSIHLLIPQVEHFIRSILKYNKIRTTVFDNEGIETEKGLSNLLEESKLKELIDIDIISELKILLTNAIGYNLRNNIAHGLSSNNIFNSTQVLYLWWFVLKLVVMTSPLDNIIEEKLKNNNPLK